MRKNKIIIPVIFFAAIVISVIAGLRLGSSNEQPAELTPQPTPELRQILNNVETEEPLPEEIPYVGIYYLVKSIGDELSLVEINGEVQKTIKKINIDLDMFPTEDRRMLQIGIKANTLEDGYSILEDFSS